MRKKKTKLLVGDHSPKWYFFYSISAALMIIGFFYIFNYYATLPQQTVTGMQTVDVEIGTVEDVLYQRYTVPVIGPSKEYPVLMPFAILLAVIGTAGFITTKLFYEKNNKKKR